jgi:predicted MFS family arabinose efflux permease
MSLGWGATSGAAINIILGPWFHRRRGLAVSIAFTGATLGGVIVAPSLIPLIAGVGFASALALVAVVAAAVSVGVAVGIMRRMPESIGLGPDGEQGRAAPNPVRPVDTRGWRRQALRTWRFWSVSAPFALGLAAQVGVLTHLVTLVLPTLGTSGAAGAVSVTTAAAIVGRLVTSVVVDRADRRLVAAVTLGLQMVGVGLLGWAPSAAFVYAGCTLFGLGVGNLTTLPGLILAVEWPAEQFGALVGLAVGINQLTFAFGPSLVAFVRDWVGGYAPALGVCAALQAVAAVLVLCGPGRARTAPSGH